MKRVNIIWPHQLYKKNPLVTDDAHCIIVEVDLFFTQYKFHQQKIAFHRGSMQAYAKKIGPETKSLEYIEAHDERATVSKLMANYLTKESLKSIPLTAPMIGLNNK